MDNNLEMLIEFLVELVSVAAVIVGVALGIQKHYVYFLITVLGFAAIFNYQRIKRRIKDKRIKEIIKEQWGKERNFKRDFSKIRQLHDLLISKEKFDFIIDDITWSDLDMDIIFSKIDHTMSFPGMQYLYHILRVPSFEEDFLKKRNNIINRLMENKALSNKLQFPLFILGKEKGEDIITYFEKGIDVDTRPLNIYRFLSFLPLVGIGLLFYDMGLAFTAIIFIVSINLFFYNKNKRAINLEIENFKYIGDLILCAESIIKVGINEIESDLDEMNKVLKNLRALKKNIIKLRHNDSYRSELELIIDYLNMLVLREPKIFYKTVNLLNKHREDLLNLYVMVGQVDAYIALASYKSSLKYHTEPTLKKDKGFYLYAEKLYHPLLEEPVPYNVELNNKGALITGSNASGKSTFLKTIGINSLFAQTLYFVFAKKYTANYFRLFSSIGTTDSIVEGDSYFMAEAKALKRVIDSIDGGSPILCILDEIFRGTNTAERISAAQVVLDYLIEKDNCVIAATHDLELTSLVSEKYENYHFRETIDDEDISFDYILRPGPCVSSNAIAILKYIGYPKDIYEVAKEKAEKYLIKA
ncbi:MAG: DNA mismatch repair protein MutS [Tissierellia bacterium]|nr:DNA mismatch repair protein MutS [Tissierellia bacterium]